MKGIALLLFDQQLLSVIGALRKLQSCFPIFLAQSWPSKSQRAYMELKKEGWTIEKVAYTYPKTLIKRLKPLVCQKKISKFVVLPAQESFQRKMVSLIQQSLYLVVDEEFGELVLQACRHFQSSLKERLQKYNELAFQQINQKFSLLIDEDGELIVEGLRRKTEKGSNRFQAPLSFVDKRFTSFSSQKISFILEGEKEI